MSTPSDAREPTPPGEPGSGPLPRELEQYLRSPALTPLWNAVAARLERNGHRISGAVTVDVDVDGAHVLGGVVPRPVRPGRVRVRLSELDATLRASPAARGLVAVTAALRGELANRPAQRAAADAARQQLMSLLDAELAAVGLAEAPWVPAWVDATRRSGVLTRAGLAAHGDITTAVSALGTLARTSATWLTGDTSADTAAASAAADGAHERWELASLASHIVGSDAHALDADRLAGSLVLRAAAAADGTPSPTTAAERRAAWERMGVAPDALSGTVLTWRLAGIDGSAWAVMMAERARLHLVTHLSVHELTGAASGVRFVEPKQVVFCCENPQLMQAAAAADVPGILLCLSGNPSSAGLLLLDRLLADGADVRYHGDFDWPGVAIAGRLIDRGASPWRLIAPDYLDAVRALPASRTVALSGRACATAWDADLGSAMARVGIAVHEESLRSTLLADIA